MDEQPADPREQPKQPPGTQPPRLTRSRSNRVIAGVCGGIAEHFGLDPVLVRLAWVALILFGGGGVLLYIVAWIIMPEAEGDAPPVSSVASSDTARIVIGAVLILLGLVWLAGPISIGVIRFGIPAALVVAGAYIILAKR